LLEIDSLVDAVVFEEKAVEEVMPCLEIFDSQNLESTSVSGRKVSL